MSKRARMNVVLMLADQLRADSVGCLGHSSRVQAVVDCFGPTDLARIIDGLGPEEEKHIRHVCEKFFGGPIEGREALVKLANPAAHVTPDDPPFSSFTANGIGSCPLPEIHRRISDFFDRHLEQE